MICPHCDADTPMTSPICLECGGDLDVKFDDLTDEIEEREAQREQRFVAERARVALSFALLAFLLVLAARLLLVQPVDAPLPEPAYRVTSDLAPALNELPFRVPEIEIPDR